MIVDIHAHIVDRAYFDQLVATCGLEREDTGDGKSLFRHNGFTVSWSRPDMFDIEARLADMDRKGIDMRVLSLSTPNVYPFPPEMRCRITVEVNDALAKICRAHPTRFVGLGSLPLPDVPASLAELDRCVLELGMKGVIIGSNVGGPPLNDSIFEPLWARINELRLPVFEHPMFPRDTSDLGEFELPLRVGLIADTTLVAARLIYSGVFERYPDFPYIMAHTGGSLLVLLARLDNGYKLFPDCRKYISQLPSVYARRLYYDTCAFDPEVLMLATRSVGSDHLLFGTDDPFIDSDTRHVRVLNLDATDEVAVLGGNVIRLLGLPV
jgi:aminocarboxymuconate-semialdehyde decarboxylase